MKRDSNSIRLPRALPQPDPLHEPLRIPGQFLVAYATRNCPGGFIAPMHGLKAEGALHEPTHPRLLPGGERAFVRAVSVPLPGGDGGGFTVPMHAIKVEAAFVEPHSAAGILLSENATLPARRRQHVRGGAGAARFVTKSLRMTFCWFVFVTLCPAFAQEARLVSAKMQTRAVASSLEKEFQSLVKDQAE